LYESKISAAHDNNESELEPLGNSELTKFTSDCDCSVMKLPNDGDTKPNRYVSGRSASTQLFAYNVNTSVTACPLVGVTMNVPGLGGAFTVTLIDAYDDSPDDSVAVR
jgi:hypothetical protein